MPFWTYAVGVLAFGRAVLYLLIVFAFALCERKNEKRKMRSTMLPQALGIYCP
jgi:hypothetical protein